MPLVLSDLGDNASHPNVYTLDDPDDSGKRISHYYMYLFLIFSFSF